jgi:chromosomal replication initiation ATPase DnaA
MSARDVISVVSKETGVSVSSILSDRKWHSIVVARKLAARRLRSMGFSYPEIGRALGGLHHTSAMYLCGRLDEYRSARVVSDVALLMASPETRGSA